MQTILSRQTYFRAVFLCGYGQKVWRVAFSTRSEALQAVP
jgi:hypothetical protein